MYRSSLWIILLMVFTGFLPAEDWPQRRGLLNNGTSSETSWSHSWPAEGPPVAWKNEVGIGFSSVVISSGKAYTAGNTNDQETLYCLDAGSGRDLWKLQEGTTGTAMCRSGHWLYPMVTPRFQSG